MKVFILLTFGFLGWTFYTLSGGADYVPKEGSRQAHARAMAAAEDARMASVVQVPADDAGQADANRSDLAPEAVASDLGIAPDMLVMSALNDSVKLLQNVAPADVDAPEALPDARVASLTLAEPEAFAQAAGYAPATETLTDETPETFQRLEDLRRITGNRVNIRTGPGTGYGVSGQVTRGTEVEVLDGLSSGWLQLRVRDSQQIGWVASSLVSDSEG